MAVRHLMEQATRCSNDGASCNLYAAHVARYWWLGTKEGDHLNSLLETGANHGPLRLPERPDHGPKCSTVEESLLGEEADRVTPNAPRHVTGVLPPEPRPRFSFCNVGFL